MARPTNASKTVYTDADVDRELVRRHGKSSLSRFYDTVGMDEVSRALMHSDDPRASRILEKLYSPCHSQRAFSSLCMEEGLSLGQVIRMITSFRLDLGILKMSGYLPDLMVDTAQDALSQRVFCKRCDGLGSVPVGEDSTRVCPSCDGEGKVRQPGDKDARALLFKSIGLTRDPMVTVNNTIQTFRTASILEEADRILDVKEEYVTEE